MSNPSKADVLPPQSALFATASIEWQTLALTTMIYGGFLAVTWFWQSLPLVAVVALGGWLIAWHGSLQHEVIHGHPTRSRFINDAIGWPPLSLWLPYSIYRDGHLMHHRDEHLTDPIEDPESSYFTQAAWERMGHVGNMIAAWNMTLLGRLTIGPVVMIFSFLAQELAIVLKGDQQRAALWARHAIGVTFVLIWVVYVCKMPPWLYLFGFVYLGAALSRLRSYAEHRYADHHDERTAVVENSPLFGLLFLYNNLHILHHKRPGLPWYQIPLLYRRHRKALLGINGGLVYNGYLDVARRFFLKAHDDPRHPAHRQSATPTYAEVEGAKPASLGAIVPQRHS
ncbi:fatty acid desaturase [Rhizobium mesoamericanum]|uniref:fatty acid desaturase n=1 Tax=Rhizobium mesoamericanum TaxID=1079800 RepID=UPI0027869263|nr:fatty acid desaturase [Rhizobium mesoamericanum]MDQ0564105.1 fatty acid desaturase [Rhizobium mesoamericanum]